MANDVAHYICEGTLAAFCLLELWISWKKDKIADKRRTDLEILLAARNFAEGARAIAGSEEREKMTPEVIAAQLQGEQLQRENLAKSVGNLGRFPWMQKGA